MILGYVYASLFNCQEKRWYRWALLAVCLVESVDAYPLLPGGTCGCDRLDNDALACGALAGFILGTPC